MKSLNYKSKFSSSKKRKPLYPKQIESKNKEYNDKIKLKNTMDNYFRGYKQLSETLGLKKNPSSYGVIFTKKEIEEAYNNIDSMIENWDILYNFSPTYNPQIEDNLFKGNNILFEKTQNPIIKEDYELRIEKINSSIKKENIDLNQNLNIDQEEKAKFKSKKKLDKKKKNKNQKLNTITNKKKNLDNISEKNIEEENKSEDIKQNINENNEEYKFDDKDNNINENNEE